jgi:phenylacetic acid degradation operon negative regulatory protein
MINRCNMPVVPAIRPFNARSLVLSVLLGLDPPELPARDLVRLAELFGIAAGTMRTALSRMAATGELAGDADGYRLVGRLLERKAAQDIGRRTAPEAWDGAWLIAVVTATRRDVAARRAFRTHMANMRMGELRPDTWLRPANLAGPDGEAGLVVVRGPLDGEDAAVLAARLWPLSTIAAQAVELGRRVDAMLPALADRRPAAVPPAITLAAEVVHFLRAEPLLPPSLTPQPWTPDALRDRYREFDRALGRSLVPAIRGGELS